MSESRIARSKSFASASNFFDCSLRASTMGVRVSVAHARWWMGDDKRKRGAITPEERNRILDEIRRREGQREPLNLEQTTSLPAGYDLRGTLPGRMSPPAEQAPFVLIAPGMSADPEGEIAGAPWARAAPAAVAPSSVSQRSTLVMADTSKPMSLQRYAEVRAHLCCSTYSRARTLAELGVTESRLADAAKLWTKRIERQLNRDKPGLRDRYDGAFAATWRSLRESSGRPFTDADIARCVAAESTGDLDDTLAELDVTPAQWLGLRRVLVVNS